MTKLNNSTEEYTFNEIQRRDIPKLRLWLSKKHVQSFWNESYDKDYLINKYIENINSNISRHYIVHLNDIPIGFIQYYWAAGVGNGWWKNYSEDIIGMDQYIGEEGYINKGHGTKLILAFIDKLKKEIKFSKVIVDPNPLNVPAIRCYTKCGFTNRGEVLTPDGEALLMEWANNGL